MDPLLAAIIVLVVLVMVLWGLGLPGRIANARGHHQRDAIAVCGWLGLLFWPCWLVALIWAYTAVRDDRRTF